MSTSTTIPAENQWGKYIALGDQEAGGTYQTGVWPSTISGRTIVAATSEVAFKDSCYSDYTDDVNPFFTNEKGGNIAPTTKKRATKMVGLNLWCVDAGSGKLEYWPYPSGALPISLPAPPSEPYGAAISRAK
jgi:hypothetical protein